MSKFANLDDFDFEDEVKLAPNGTGPFCACVLLLDTSGSMDKGPIDALNQGLIAFHDALLKDPLAAQRVEAGVITFGGEVKVIQPFVSVDQFVPPRLTAGGATPMAEAILTALDLVEERKAYYREFGLLFFRPWIFMVTDGVPTDSDAIAEATRRLHEAERGRHVAFFPVAVEGADIAKLREISVRPPVKLKELQFVEMFVWLSGSLSGVSRAQVGGDVELAPIGWGRVSS